MTACLGDVSQRRAPQPISGVFHSHGVPTLPRPLDPHDSNHQLCLLLRHHPPQRRSSLDPSLYRRRHNLLLRHAIQTRLHGLHAKSSNNIHHRRNLRSLRRMRLFRLHSPHQCLPQEALYVLLAAPLEPGPNFINYAAVCSPVRGSHPGYQ